MKYLICNGGQFYLGEDQPDRVMMSAQKGRYKIVNEPKDQWTETTPEAADHCATTYPDIYAIVEEPD